MDGRSVPDELCAKRLVISVILATNFFLKKKKKRKLACILGTWELKFGNIFKSILVLLICFYGISFGIDEKEMALFGGL